nr:hypothetical protein [Tanacetum cinerariifolium]
MLYLNPPVLSPIPPEGVKVMGETRTRDLPSQTSPPQAPKESWWPTKLAQLVIYFMKLMLYALCVLACKAKRICGRIAPNVTTNGDAKQAVEAAGGPRMVLDVPEFSYRMVDCRSRKPFLDTIVEDPIGASVR